MIIGPDRQHAYDSRTAREFARAAGWRCAACGRKIGEEGTKSAEPWTSLLPGMQPAHVRCLPPVQMHDLRETWGEPAYDRWLWRPHLPDLRTVPDA